MTNHQTHISVQTDLTLSASDRGEAKPDVISAQGLGIQKNSTIDCPVIPLVTGVKLTSYSRVILLIPNIYVDDAGLSKAIRSVIPNAYANLLLVRLIHDDDEEPVTRRRLASLASLIREPGIKVDTQIMWGKSWIKAFHKLIQDGDAIICPEELNVSAGIRKRIRLCDRLSSALNVPVYTLSGYFPDPSPHNLRSIQRILYWVVLVGIFVGFFVFEVNIESLPDNWLQKTLESGVIIGEVSLIYMWTSVMG